MPQITVIVPVYRVEQYLPACVDSILAQTFIDFELILVDDGSPDNCGMICDRYADKDRRIKVIHQKNQGLSGARNSGMNMAKGKYITFIDSDDVVTHDFLIQMLGAIKKTKADIAVCKMYEFEDGTDIEQHFGKREKESGFKVFSNREACMDLYIGRGNIPVNACAKLFSSKIIGNKRFPTGRLHEDQAFTPVVCYEARRIISLDIPMYYYRTRQGSITREKFSLKRYDDIWAIDSCIRFFELRDEDDIIEAAKNKRKRLICTYAIYARRDEVAVPEEYKISIYNALRYLRTNVSDEKFDYYLGQVSKRLLHLHEYMKKIEKVLNKK